MRDSIILFLLFSGMLLSCKPSVKVPKETNPILTKAPITPFTDTIYSGPTADAYYKRGNALHKIEQDTLALADFKKAISLDSTKATYYSAVGNLMFEHKDLSGSVPYLQKALARDPADVQAHLKLAKAMIFTKDYNKAFEEINTVLRRDAYNPEGYYLKGIIYKETKDTAHALSSFNSAVNAVPDYKDAVLQIGQIYLAQGNVAGLQYLENAYRLDTTDVLPLYARGMWYQQKGEMETAKDEYHRAILHDRNYANAYFNTGFILLQQDSFEKARSQFDYVTKIVPNDAGAFYNRGLCAELMGNKTTATQDYNQALTLDKDYKQAKEGIKRMNK